MAFIWAEPWCYASLADTARGAWVISSGQSYSTSAGRYGLGAVAVSSGTTFDWAATRGFEAAGELLHNFALKWSTFAVGEYQFYGAGNGNGNRSW